MPGHYALDDAAAAFAWMLPRRYPDSAQYEYASGLFSDRTYSEPRTSRQRTSFNVRIPGNLEALIHNHPAAERQDRARDARGKKSESEAVIKFSPEDLQTAHQLGKPSYISTPSGRVRRYDPATRQQNDVLAQFPIDEVRAYLQSRFPQLANLRITEEQQLELALRQTAQEIEALAGPEFTGLFRNRADDDE